MTPHELKARCHRLINEIAKRPGAAKLLARAATELEALSNYKSHRRLQQGKRSPPIDDWRIGS